MHAVVIFLTVNESKYVQKLTRTIIKVFDKITASDMTILGKTSLCMIFFQFLNRKGPSRANFIYRQLSS